MKNNPVQSPKITKIKETCLYVTDTGRSREFYELKIGLPVISEVAGEHVFFRAGEDVLLFFKPEHSRQKTSIPPHYGSGHLHFAFECSEADYPKWKAKVAEAGIEIEDEIDWGNGRLSFYFRDPDMHCVEIIMPGVWD